MRTNRLLALVAVVSFLVVPSTVLASSATSDSSVIKATPSKVCHPKKPITCRAADLSTIVDATPVSVLSVEETPKASAAMSTAVCTGPKWHCRTQTLDGASAPAMMIAPVVSQKQAMMTNAVCTGPKWHCRTQTLGASPAPAMKVAPVASQVEQKQAMMNNAVCTGPKWHCRTQTLG